MPAYWGRYPTLLDIRDLAEEFEQLKSACMIPCGDCNEIGYEDEDKLELCPTCDGEGEVEATVEESLDRQDASRLAALEELAVELGCDPDPASLLYFGNSYEPTLILESTFVLYAEQLAEEIGAVDSDASWPNTYIDWEAAAEALAMDYTEVEFDGDTYKIHSW